MTLMPVKTKMVHAKAWKSSAEEEELEYSLVFRGLTEGLETNLEVSQDARGFEFRFLIVNGGDTAFLFTLDAGEADVLVARMGDALNWEVEAPEFDETCLINASVVERWNGRTLLSIWVDSLRKGGTPSLECGWRFWLSLESAEFLMRGLGGKLDWDFEDPSELAADPENKSRKAGPGSPGVYSEQLQKLEADLKPQSCLDPDPAAHAVVLAS